jgi:hypothetical protein
LEPPFFHFIDSTEPGTSPLSFLCLFDRLTCSFRFLDVNGFHADPPPRLRASLRGLYSGGLYAARARGVAKILVRFACAAGEGGRSRTITTPPTSLARNARFYGILDSSRDEGIALSGCQSAAVATIANARRILELESYLDVGRDPDNSSPRSGMLPSSLPRAKSLSSEEIVDRGTR